MVRVLLTALIVLGVAATGCAYPVAGADPADANPAHRGEPTSDPHALQPAAGTAKLISAELRGICVIADRPDVPGYRRDQFGETWTDVHAGRPAAWPVHLEFDLSDRGPTEVDVTRSAVLHLSQGLTILRGMVG
ncbi:MULTISPECIES: hypothetical protein [unclassified Kribbella]|uniref:hypothetical protein n=1 Tax=unclassified Kribbella TaxID=2644121 RepID=UPI0033CE257B